MVGNIFPAAGQAAFAELRHHAKMRLVQPLHDPLDRHAPAPEPTRKAAKRKAATALAAENQE